MIGDTELRRPGTPHPGAGHDHPQVESGPYYRPRRVPGRGVWNPAAVDDGSRTLVDLGTGEIVEVPPSEARARRLRARADLHAARVQDEARAAGIRAREWAAVAREGLPVRVPPGLERPAGYQPGGSR